jgi:predicted Fe-Mo cluster-binding NifX family protein
MKIVISSSGKNKDSALDKRFGRCEYFQIFDMDTKEFNVLSNDGAASSGGAGIAAASQVIEEGVDVVITGNLGPNAFELLEKAGIKAYSCEAVPVSESIEMFQKNQLSEIGAAGNAHHGI